MSNITEQITRLQTAKANLKTSLEAKGVTVADDATLDAYPALVDSIPSGGGEVEEKDVNFYDYDGICIYSYTKNEFLALNEMPANPDHSDEGLTSDGWNWTLVNAKAYVLKYSKLNIGQLYNYNNQTALFVDTTKHNETITLKLFTTKNADVTVNWGDNTSTTESCSSGVQQIFSHDYTNGKFIITFTISNDAKLHCNYNANSHFIMNNYCIYKIIIGQDFTNIISYNTFENLFDLEFVLLSSNITQLYDASFNNTKIKCFILPKDISYFSPGRIIFLKVICFSDSSILDLGSYIGNSSNIDNLYIPESVTTIHGYLHQSKFKIIIFPETITNIQNYALKSENQEYPHDLYCYALVPPSLSSNAFIGRTGLNIYVPASVVEDYKAESNWSVYASQIQAIPE